ncbi:MAG TPA: hypothetical protein VMG36_01845 [Thermoplasmata archaeon]|nr:hypothetical protein [Thermoplasmata archaeon]
MVRVYRSDGRWRVVVDGLAHFEVDGPTEVEPAARRVILDRLRAYLPDRHRPVPESELESFQLYDLLLVRVDVPDTAPVGSGTKPPDAPHDSARRRVTGRQL